MDITISSTEFRANGITQVQITIPNDIYSATISSAVTGLKMSLTNSNFQSTLMFSDGGTYTVYIRCGNLDGYYPQGIVWQANDAVGIYEGSFNVTVVGSAPKHFDTFSMSLSPRASTIQYSGEQVNGNLSVGGNVSGHVLDHQYTLEVERYTKQGSRFAFAGAFQATKLVESLITYEVEYEWSWQYLGWVRPSFRDHLTAISNAIGLSIVYTGADFYPKTDMNIMLRNGLGNYREKISGSFSEILNRLIGWSTDVPAMTINLFVESGTIYLVQRGYETNTLTPDGIVMHPTLTYSRRHTEWANSTTQTVVPKEIASSDAAAANQPFTGTISFGSASLTYDEGILVSETSGNTVTTYTYTSIGDDKYLSQKVSVTTDTDTGDTSTATTTYTYNTTDVDVYLREEHLTVVDYNGDTTTDRITTHSPIGNGWYGTSTRDLLDEDAVVSDSLSMGSPGQKASQYLIDNANDSIKHEDSSNPRGLVIALQGVPKARATYPISDYNTLSAIASCLDQYEGKIEVQLQCELVGGTHLFNYSDKISYDGYAYYIVSNNVRMTGDTIRQSITAVRYELT